jgi:hypothetical protein
MLQLNKLLGSSNKFSQVGEAAHAQRHRQLSSRNEVQ